LSLSVTSDGGVVLDQRETTSVRKAWDNVREFIDRGVPVGLQVDMYHLDYFDEAFHFAGHYLTVYGYDDTCAYVVDTGTKHTTLLENLAKARSEKGPMAARNRSYTITAPEMKPPDVRTVTAAIRSNAETYLSSPIRNLGSSGIEKLARDVPRWLEVAPSPTEDLSMTAMMMEEAGTGGALFRNLYRDFLKEDVHSVGLSGAEPAYRLFCEVAPKWNIVSSLLVEAGRTQDRAHLEEASAVLEEIAVLERQAMEHLATLE
jgi:hypothetical protein